MNATCNGQRFTIKGKAYYCCFHDGSLIDLRDVDAPAPKECPRCERETRSREFGEVSTYTVTYAQLGFRNVEIP